MRALPHGRGGAARRHGARVLTDALHRVVRSTANPRPVGLLRALFGALVLLRGVYFIEQAGVATREGLVIMSGAGSADIVLLVAVWFTLGVALLVGWHSRWAAGAYAVLVFALLGTDALFYNNHLYLMGLVAGLLACADSGAAFSLDARRRGTVAEVPAWPMFLMRLQVSIVYAFAASSKVQEDFVSGLSLHVHLSRGPFAPLLPSWLVDSFVVLVVAAVAVIVVQATLVWALWHPSWQDRAFTLGLLLHAPMVLLANSWHQAVRLLVFALLMWGLYLVFLRAPVRGRTLRWDPGDPVAAAAARICQRLDWLEAVTFQTSQPLHDCSARSPGRPDATRDAGLPRAPALELRDLDGSIHTGFQGLQRVLRVLPITCLFAGAVAHPLGRRLGNAALVSVARSRSVAASSA